MIGFLDQDVRGVSRVFRETHPSLWGRQGEREREDLREKGMKARLTLKPTHRKAKKFYRKYGDRLVYVRYRYDAVRQKRFTTVEIIVDEADWLPPRAPLPEEIVGVRVEKEERDVQLRIKQVGGKWNWRKRVWELRYDAVLELGLRNRMVGWEDEDIK